MMSAASVGWGRIARVIHFHPDWGWGVGVETPLFSHADLDRAGGGRRGHPTSDSVPPQVLQLHRYVHTTQVT